MLDEKEILLMQLDEIENKLDNVKNKEQFDVMKTKREKIIEKLKKLGFEIIDDFTQTPIM